MAAPNPLEGISTSSALSSQTFFVAGISVDVHGLSEVPSTAESITCLWLLHPRTTSKDIMALFAAPIISGFNSHGPKNVGLIAAAFDQRNHGSRLVDKLHNEAWGQGNPQHAQDMFSCYHGTSVDCSQLIDHLESYILPSPSSPSITNHMVLGISLGGHAAWHCLLFDPRITAGIVGIGCPDYTRLMTDRARLSELKSYTASSPPGSAFLGSADFPKPLQDAVARYDPAGLLLPGTFNPAGADTEVSKAALDRFKTIARERLGGKHILTLNGRDDELVPYAAGKPFLDILKQVLAEDITLNIDFEEEHFEGVGHSFPAPMVKKATQWICNLLNKDVTI